jgi:hypothetical protein
MVDVTKCCGQNLQKLMRFMINVGNPGCHKPIMIGDGWNPTHKKGWFCRLFMNLGLPYQIVLYENAWVYHAHARKCPHVMIMGKSQCHDHNLHKDTETVWGVHCDAFSLYLVAVSQFLVLRTCCDSTWVLLNKGVHPKHPNFFHANQRV